MSTPTYRRLSQAQAGERAQLESEANSMAEIKANEILEGREAKLREEQDFIDQISEAKAIGIAEGSRAGKLDATRMFAQRGFIPGEFAAMAEAENNAINARKEAQNGLGMQAENANAAAETQAEDISTKLLEASMQGAGDEQINATLDQLPLPPQVKAEAAKRFLQKRKEISGQEAGGNRPMKQMLPGSAVERMNSPVTEQSKNIMAETDQRMQQLHQLLNPQQQG